MRWTRAPAIRFHPPPTTFYVLSFTALLLAAPRVRARFERLSPCFPEAPERLNSCVRRVFSDGITTSLPAPEGVSYPAP